MWKTTEDATDEVKSSLLAYYLELTTMAAIAETNEQMREIYLSSYTYPMTLDRIRLNDCEKLKCVFGAYCAGWTDERFFATECIVSGIEYAILMTTEHFASLPERIRSALNAIGKQMLRDFKSFAQDEHRKAVDEMLTSYRLK